MTTAMTTAVQAAGAIGTLPWTNLRVPAEDGTLLALDVHVPPESAWPVPVVVTRTPYGRSRHLAEGRGWRARGYGYVVADVRGRYDSDGEWLPYHHERADSAAVADWILIQPWCDGRLVAYGGSYSGYTAWTLAVERPDAVAAVVSLGPSMSLAGTKLDPSGVLRLGEHAAWWLERAESRTSREGLARQVFAEQPDLLDHLPVVEIGDRLGAQLDRWSDLLVYGDTGEHLSDAELAGVGAAALHVGGWYDLLLPEALHHWRTVGSARSPRPARHLMIGPWDHDLAFAADTAVGGREHGPTSRRGFDDWCLSWLGAVLAESAPRSQAEVFVLGDNTWRTVSDLDEVPAAPSALPTLDAGRLGEPGAAADTGGATCFVYDPADPFPSRHPGADRADTASRADAVRFTTDPLEAAWTIWGAPEVDLVANADGPAETDWVVRLLEQHRDGRLLEIARATVVDAVGRRTVTLGHTAITVAPGSRLVLEITGSDFPDLARNLGSGQDRYRGTDLRAATCRVHWGVDGTRLRLPLTTEGAR